MLKLISLNIERSKHLERNMPFFQNEKPDVLCLQEVFEPDLGRIKKELDFPFCVWQPDCLIDDPTNSTGEPDFSGNAIFSRIPFLEQGTEYYFMPEGGIALEPEAGYSRQANANGVLWTTVEYEGKMFTVMNTHFTSSNGGNIDNNQKEDFERLKKILAAHPPHILVGDLNAPRGREMWEKFAMLYDQDNIPEDVTSTIDPALHRVSGLNFVVDCLFTQKPFFAKDVRIVEGLSDHKGVVAHIGRVEE